MVTSVKKGTLHFNLFIAVTASLMLVTFIFLRVELIYIIFFLLSTVYFYFIYLKLKRYRLRLDKGLIKESKINKTREIKFVDIESLKLEVIHGFNYIFRYYLVFRLIDSAGNLIILKTQENLEITKLLEWVKSNYPECDIEEEIYKYRDWN